MEGLLEASLQFLFEFVFEIVGEILGEALSHTKDLLNGLAKKLNLHFEISFSEEITKLNLFE